MTVFGPRDHRSKLILALLNPQVWPIEFQWQYPEAGVIALWDAIHHEGKPRGRVGPMKRKAHAVKIAALIALPKHRAMQIFFHLGRDYADAVTPETVAHELSQCPYDFSGYLRLLRAHRSRDTRRAIERGWRRDVPDIPRRPHIKHGPRCYRAAVLAECGFTRGQIARWIKHKKRP